MDVEMQQRWLQRAVAKNGLEKQVNVSALSYGDGEQVLLGFPDGDMSRDPYEILLDRIDKEVVPLLVETLIGQAVPSNCC